MEPVRIGINGLGRIGRCTLREAMRRQDVEVAAVNDLVSPDEAAYLIRRDSVHGPYPGRVDATASAIHLDAHTIPCFSEDRPERIPWGEAGAEVVVEATGAFRSRDDAGGHLESGARKVVISAPSDDADLTIVLGVNQHEYDAGVHHVLSNASCTTNCVAPVLKVLDEAFGLELGVFTTVHAYTSSQALVDGPKRKRRRGRAAALSLVPTTTGAATATEKVLPALAGRLDGAAIRAPVPDGSITDLVARLEVPVDADAVLAAFREAGAGPMAGILGVTDDELVSADIVGDTHSALIDGPSTRVLDGRTVKVLAWYDNEVGYSARLVDLARMIGV
jgi:glyceraldehyde 3-phosphate dehydrogenase